MAGRMGVVGMVKEGRLTFSDDIRAEAENRRGSESSSGQGACQQQAEEGAGPRAGHLLGCSEQ